MTTTSPARRYLPAALTALFVLAAVGTVLFGTGDGDPDGPLAGDREPCATRTPLTMAASSEKAELLRRMAAEYGEVPGGCADVEVLAVNSGQAAEALRRGWNTAADGPRPDVWSPAASSWIPIARQAAAAGVVPEEGPSLAQTPLVIAMPAPMAEVLGWPDAPLGWGDLVRLAQDPRGWGGLGRPEWGPFTLGKTNPTISTSGLHAMLGAYQAAPAPAGPVSAEKVNDPAARAFERSVESAVVHYGPTELTFLQNLDAAGREGRGLTYISAVAVEEKAVWDYNRGDAGSLGAATAPPSVPLAAFTPRDGTAVSDNPYLVLDWAETTTDPTREAALDFGRWLVEPAQQARFGADGFRDRDGVAPAMITEASGLLPAPPSTVIEPDPATVAATLASWPDVRKRAGVTLVLDRSGSMGQPVADTGRTRLDLAQDAAKDALAQLSPDDSLSLWTFSSAGAGESTPYRIEVPPGAKRDVEPAVRRAIDSISVGGDTALYATTRAAVAEERRTADPNRINGVVLLTDGENVDPGEPDPAAVRSELSAAATDPDVPPVRVFFIAYTEEANSGVLDDLARASGGSSTSALDPRSIERVFSDVLANF